jgi:two-component system OmpR family sensor kinase
VLRTLYAKLALALLLVFLAVGLVQVALTVRSTRLYQQDVAQKLNRELASHLAQDRVLLRGGEVDRAALADVFHMLMVINPSIEIYLLDPAGAILAYSAPAGKVRLDRVSLGPVRRFLEGGAELPVFGDDPRSPGRKKVFSAAPIAPRAGAAPEGYLYVILGGEEYDSVAEALRVNYALRLSALATAGSLVLALVAALLLFAFLTRRLRRLNDAVDRFRAGGFAEPVPVGPASASGDELDRLAASFRELADRIVAQIRALERTDALRRELVANVSHDLRTPLAALRGYIETLILKQDSLASAERTRYLEIAARHSERLGRLIEDLFELSKLEANEVRLQLERCSIAELVQDVVQRFEIAAQREGVSLGGDIRPDLPDAEVDIRLMERVLQNLIENSIHHTPRGGRVVVRADAEHGRLRVQVSDTGTGIPEEELPRVFDRFYRGSAARQEPGGTGLGLAIARRIVELHGSTLEMTSRVNAGTTASFHPPAVRTSSGSRSQAAAP